LTESSFQKDENNYIYGSKDSGKTSTITSGGTYYLAPGITKNGVITIATTEAVTLVGRGISTEAIYEDIYINCTVDGVNLTLQDVYISNSDTSANCTNLLNFQGMDNKLYFKGTCCLDWNGSATGYAAIHVPTGVSLTISGTEKTDVLYLYKHEQGAGIGGNGKTTTTSAENNGDITINQGTYFIKGSKQGATIGAGADATTASGTPGTITIGNDVVMYGIQVSRGAFIGGSAGSSGASIGADVKISSKASISINVDFSGAAIGGGGYKFGNDSDGGTVTYAGGSIRTYVDYNAVVADGTNLWEDQGITEAGVDSRVITANIYNSQGNELQPFTLDVSSIAANESGDAYVVTADDELIYSGGLHSYSYINESLQKNSQIPINYTWDNWTASTDTNLYLYLTKEEHTLDVNGTKVKVSWDKNAGSFVVHEHAWDEGQVTTEATCTTDGVRTYTCSCGETKTEAIAALGHDYTAAITKAATDTEDGVMTYTCSRGDDSYTETIHATGHTAFIAVVTKPTCTAKGYTTYTCKSDDGYSYVADYVDATGHSYQAVVTAPTCTQTGYTTHTCSVCGDSYTDSQTAALGHSYEAVKRVEPTLTSLGLVTYRCKTCGAVRTETIPMLEGEAKEFTDVQEDVWYSEAIDYVTSKEIMVGFGDGTFQPNVNLTRAMMVQLLYNLADNPAVSGSSPFTDVVENAWFTKAIIWGNQQGIAMGNGDGTFSPNEDITREQMVTMLWRYAGKPSASSTTLAKYTDAGQISSYAQEAMCWAVEIGLVQGRGDNKVNPKDTATRAEAATILMRYLELQNK
jgi:hypothetical protein